MQSDFLKSFNLSFIATIICSHVSRSKLSPSEFYGEIRKLRNKEVKEVNNCSTEIIKKAELLKHIEQGRDLVEKLGNKQYLVRRDAK